jgi:hypothetical protein
VTGEIAGNNTSAFVLPCTYSCLLLPLLDPSSVRVAIEGAEVGRTDEEGIGPWIGTAGSPEALPTLSKSVVDGDATHRCSHGCLAEVSTFSMTTTTWRLR